MYKTQAEARAFFRGVCAAGSRRTAAAHCSAPPFTAIAAAVERLKAATSPLGARRVLEKRRRFHSEISAPMLSEAGCPLRNHRASEVGNFSEKPATPVSEENESRAFCGLTPSFASAELLEHREAGRTEEICETQFTGDRAR